MGDCANTHRNPRETPLSGEGYSRKGRFGQAGGAILLLGIVVALCEQPTLTAQRPLSLDQLPPPPKAIASLIRSANVRFQSGLSESARQPDWVADPRITAATRYQIVYGYSCQPNWRASADGTQVIVRMRFTRITWRTSHTLWFRSQPSAADFWSNRLVLHELDHVRLSNDSRLRKLFEQKLSEQKVLRKRVANANSTNRSMVDRWVDQHAAAVYDEVLELIDIRYRELDRLTSHGQRPMPDDSALNKILRPESAP